MQRAGKHSDLLIFDSFTAVFISASEIWPRVFTSAANGDEVGEWQLLLLPQ